MNCDRCGCHENIWARIHIDRSSSTTAKLSATDKFLIYYFWRSSCFFGGSGGGEVLYLTTDARQRTVGASGSQKKPPRTTNLSLPGTSRRPPGTIYPARQSRHRSPNRTRRCRQQQVQVLRAAKVLGASGAKEFPAQVSLPVL